MSIDVELVSNSVVVSVVKPTVEVKVSGEPGPPGGGGLDEATADARYVNIDGDTMSGPLVMLDGSRIRNTAGGATLAVDGSTYAGMYFLINDTLRYFMGGDDGVWKISRFPAAGSEANALLVHRDSGVLEMGNPVPTAPEHVASKQYVDAGRIVVVNHGANGSIVRPTAAVVYWVGAATPANAMSYDFWRDV